MTHTLNGGEHTYDSAKCLQEDEYRESSHHGSSNVEGDRPLMEFPRNIEIRSISFVCLSWNNRTACVWDKSILDDFPAVRAHVD
jgi:hypothetical protein